MMYKSNGYDNQQTTKEFFRIALILFIKKVNRLKEIDSKNKKGKLPLPLLKEKHQLISDYLSAIKLISLELDYENEVMAQFGQTLNEQAILVNEASMIFDQERYSEAIKRFTYMLID